MYSGNQILIIQITYLLMMTNKSLLYPHFLSNIIGKEFQSIGGTTWADCRINIFRINIIFLCGTYIYSPIILIHLTNTNFYGFLAYLHAGGKGGLFPAPPPFSNSATCLKIWLYPIWIFFPPLPDLVWKFDVENLIEVFCMFCLN